MKNKIQMVNQKNSEAEEVDGYAWEEEQSSGNCGGLIFIFFIFNYQGFFSI